MSLRRLFDEPPELAVDPVDVEPLLPPEEPELLLDVEYLLDPEDDDSVWTSVPNSVHSSQRSSFAPSTFVVVSDDCSAPHISHWAIRTDTRRPGIKHAPPATYRSFHAPQNRWPAVMWPITAKKTKSSSTTPYPAMIGSLTAAATTPVSPISASRSARPTSPP